MKPIYKKWWFYAAVAVALIAIISGISSKKGNGEKIEWSKIKLCTQLPEPPSSKGSLYENSNEKFGVSLNNVSDRQYDDYLDACVSKGFTVDANKSSYSYKAYNADGYSLDMSHIGDSLSITLKAPMKFDSITWPSSTVGKMLPTPKSTIGKFSYEHDDSFFVYVGETDKTDYNQYVSDCSANGFNIAYDKKDTYYRADNADGYHISLEYEGNNIMTVEIKAPKSESTSTSESATSAPSKDAAAPKESIPDDTTNLVEGMRKDFKDAMDSYEAFIDEYVALMKKYNDNPNDVSLLADYTKYITKYADMAKKFENWKNENLNNAELAYYIDVQSRVSKKLLEITN